MRHRPVRLIASSLAAAVVLAGCGASSDSPEPASAELDPTDWPSVLDAARGQTLDWYMYDGDEAINAVVQDYLTPRLADEFGVTLNIVGLTDTADAVNKVLAERQAGLSGSGTVDAIWINGANFATGKQADLWYCGYPDALPNAEYVDFEDPAIASDFGVPVDGCEAAWQQASSALVYDSAVLSPADVASLSALSDWAQVNPGRFAYPAPPDFTGSMVVRTFLYDLLGDPSELAGEYDEAALADVAGQLWERLNALEPALWRGGQTYPTSQAAVEQLYATGEISAYYTYGPGTVANMVDDGVFPATTREAVPSVGNIGNVSFLAIPDDSADKAAALVLANLLQDPETQLRFFADGGIYPAIDVERTADDVQQQFADVPLDDSVLPLADLTANVQPELNSGYVSAIDDGWITNVLQQ